MCTSIQFNILVKARGMKSWQRELLKLGLLCLIFFWFVWVFFWGWRVFVSFVWVLLFLVGFVWCFVLLWKTEIFIQPSAWTFCKAEEGERFLFEVLLFARKAKNAPLCLVYSNNSSLLQEMEWTKLRHMWIPSCSLKWLEWLLRC